MNLLRPVLAWLAAVVATAWCALFVMVLHENNLVTAISTSIGMLELAVPLGVWFGAIPSALAIWLLRWSRAPRPLGDIVAAAACGIAALVMFSPESVASIFSQSTEVYDPEDADDFSVGGFLAGVAPYLLIGAIPGGLLYWFLAGSPRPPYPSGQPPSGQSRDM